MTECHCPYSAISGDAWAAIIGVGALVAIIALVLIGSKVKWREK